MPYAIIGLYETNEGFREELTRDRYRSIIAAKKTYILAVGLEEKIKLLLDNYEEFEAELLRLADDGKRILSPETALMDRMQARIILNRRIVNVLTACRLYLDQSDHAISQLFDDRSDEVNAAEERKSTAYDNNPSYRFMEALRNHVQHRGLLVQCLSFRHSYERDDVRFRVEPRLKLSNLEEDSKFKRSIVDEIKAASAKGLDSGEIDLHRPIKEYVAAILSLHLANADAIAKGCADRFSLYRSVVKQYQQHNGKKIVFPRAVELDAQGRQITETFLLGNICEYYGKLREEEPPLVKKLRFED
jgi:hypothetical protein